MDYYSPLQVALLCPNVLQQVHLNDAWLELLTARNVRPHLHDVVRAGGELGSALGSVEKEV